MSDLQGLFGGTTVSSCSWDINDAGDVVGEYRPLSNARRGFLNSGEIMTTLEDGNDYLVRAISGNGIIVGEGWLSGFPGFSNQAVSYAVGAFSNLAPRSLARPTASLTT